jgi:hypothetical protein
MEPASASNGTASRRSSSRSCCNVAQDNAHSLETSGSDSRSSDSSDATSVASSEEAGVTVTVCLTKTGISGSEKCAGSQHTLRRKCT